MKERWFKYLVVRGLLGPLLLSTQVQAAASYKGEVAAAPSSSQARFFYKGEMDNNRYASAVVPEAKYGGRIYDSTLYQGEIQGSGYSPKTKHSLHDGFYLGAEVGYDSYKVRESINLMQNGVSLFQQNPELNAVGVSYTLLAGYGRYFDPPLYLGAEIFYNVSQANTSQNVGIFNGQTGVYYVKAVVQDSYGASLIPGVKLSDNTLLYLKGGYTRLDMRNYETSVALGVNNAQSGGANGIHWGLGLQTNLYKNWSLRGEYTHLNAQNFKTSVGTTVTPSDNQFMLGFIFHFI